MQPPSEFRLEPPDDLTPEGWLIKFDSQPTMVPRWPASRRMALVAVIVEDLQTEAESEAVGYVLTQRGQADALMDFENGLDNVGVLFFTVPKGQMIKHCPGLTQESWAQSQQG